MSRALLATAGLTAIALGVAWAASPWPTENTAPRLVEDALIAWGGATPGVGSYSGLALDPDGSRFIAVSDEGSYATGRLLRRAGRLTGVEIAEYGPLLDGLDASIEGWEIDAEDITRGADGRIYVSFEGKDRIDGYDDIAGRAAPLPRAPAFRRLDDNAGLESVFTGPDGAIYTTPENPDRATNAHPVFRYADGAWSQPFAIPHRPPHLPAGADVGPDGRLYLLERDFSWLFGFSTRIRRFRITDAGLDQEEVLLRTRAGTYDNLEGISAWRDPQGRLRLTLISDDNGNLLQRTEVVEFLLVEAAAPGPDPDD